MPCICSGVHLLGIQINMATHAGTTSSIDERFAIEFHLNDDRKFI